MSAARSIEEAAAVWLLRLEGSAAPELQAEFQKWLDEEPRHRAAFLRLRSAWRVSETLRLFRPADGSVDVDLLSKL